MFVSKSYYVYIYIFKVSRNKLYFIYQEISCKYHVNFFVIYIIISDSLFYFWNKFSMFLIIDIIFKNYKVYMIDQQDARLEIVGLSILGDDAKEME